MRRLLLLLATLVSLTATSGPLAGCGDDGEPGDRVGGAAWTELLAHVPDDPATRSSVIIGDPARAVAAGVRHPGRGAADTDVNRYVLDLIRGRGDTPTIVPDVGVLGGVRDHDASAAELGFRITDVDRFVVAGEPPAQVEILTGELDPADIEAATGSGRLGSGGRSVADDGLVLWGSTDEGLAGLLATRDGSVSSLADDDAYRQAVGVFDGYRAHGAVLGDRLPSAIDESDGTTTDPGPELTGVEVWGMGSTILDGEFRVIVVLVSDDLDGAVDNTERLRAHLAEGESAATGRPWTEKVEIVEIGTDDRVTTAVLDPVTTQLWLEEWLDADPLLLVR
jgi:hypothetical protein